MALIISLKINSRGNFECFQKTIAIYGDGSNVRDWIYVDDHAMSFTCPRRALGQLQYWGKNEQTNLELVKTLCGILDRLHPYEKGTTQT